MIGSRAPGDRSLQEIEQKFDPEMRFRPLSAPASTVVGGLLIALSAFRYDTAGFGLLEEVTPTGACTLPLCWG